MVALARLWAEAAGEGGKVFIPTRDGLLEGQVSKDWEAVSEFGVVGRTADLKAAYK